LSQGEYIAPEKIENIFQQSQFVQQNFIYGDSLRSSLVGIIIPDEKVLTEHCQKLDIKANSYAELLKDPKVVKIVKDDIVKIGKENKLKTFELPAVILLDPTVWTINDLLTPTFKLMRPKAFKQFQSAIDELYKQAPAELTSKVPEKKKKKNKN